MEFSIHQDMECAYAEIPTCRGKMKENPHYSKEGMINIFHVDAEELFYRAWHIDEHLQRS